MDLGLRGKAAVVTGASVDTGLDVAEAFARDGADVVPAARGPEQLNSKARRLGETDGARAVAVVCDISTAEGTKELISSIEAKLGGADIRDDDAGTSSHETMMEAPDGKWQAYWDLHVMAAVKLARGMVAMMKARGGGAILHDASICAVQPLWYEPICNVTKTALPMFSENLANEVISDNIRINTINPESSLIPDWIKTAEQPSGRTDRGGEGCLMSVAEDDAPIQRFATVEELADSFVFLCCERARDCIGATYRVDGGMLKGI